MSLVRRLAHPIARYYASLSKASPLALTHLAAQSHPSSQRRKNVPSSTRLFLYASSAATFYSVAFSSTSYSPFFRHALSEYSTTATAATEATNIPEIVLYQYEVCPFCNKVRAYLDYHNIPYRIVEVDPLRKTELKHFSNSYRKVPIAVVNGIQINGSANVIDEVHRIVHGEEAPVTNEDRQWLIWLDDLFIHLISPNIYRTSRESLQTFDYIADNSKFSPWQRSTIRYTGAAAMYFVGRRLKKKYNIDDERSAIHEALANWTTAIRQGGGKFLGGRDVPGMADLSVYGVLKAIQRFDTFAEIRERNEELGEWFDRTKAAVGDETVTSRD